MFIPSFWRLFKCSQAAVKYFIGTSHPNFRHGPSASIRAHLFQPYFPVLSAQWGFYSITSQMKQKSSALWQLTVPLVIISHWRYQTSQRSCLSELSSMSQEWSVTNHLRHLVLIKLQPFVNTERAISWEYWEKFIPHKMSVLWSGPEQDTCIHAISCGL